MKCFLAVLLCSVTAVYTDDAPQGYYGGPHGTTVCIEIHPSPHGSPTRVCGPVVHGGNAQARPKGAEPSFPQPQLEQQSEESDESREAEVPCATGGQRPSPNFQQRQQQQQQQPPQTFMPRMDLPNEGMMPMVPMEFDGTGWRQAGPPCASPSRASQPLMPFSAPMMGPRPMPFVHPRTWMVPPLQPMGVRNVEEPPKQLRNSDMGMRASEDSGKPTPPPSRAQSLESLLKECEEKTKLLQEKEAKISELKSQIGNNKKEAQPSDSNNPKNESKQ